MGCVLQFGINFRDATPKNISQLVVLDAHKLPSQYFEEQGVFTRIRINFIRLALRLYNFIQAYSILNVGVFCDWNGLFCNLLSLALFV